MLTGTFKILNPQGFHVRPTKAFVDKSSSYQCDVFLDAKGRRINGKSSLGIMTLGLKQHDEVVLEVDGADEKQALEELGAILTAIYE